MTVKFFNNGRYTGNPTNGIGTCCVCGKHNYIINVDHIPHKDKFCRVNGIEKYGGIPVDHCIAKEVEYLIMYGIITRACCCGHKQYEPDCLISEESVDLVKRLGYKPIPFGDGLYRIRLEGLHDQFRDNHAE